MNERWFKSSLPNLSAQPLCSLLEPPPSDACHDQDALQTQHSCRNRSSRASGPSHPWTRPRRQRVPHPIQIHRSTSADLSKPDFHWSHRFPIIGLVSLFAVTLVLSSCARQFYIDPRIEKNPHHRSDVYIFPILKGGDRKVANKINSRLIEDQLYLEYGHEKNSIFENVWKTPEKFMYNVGELTYDIELFNDALYSVSISGEWCSAYCEHYDMTYTFDLESGDLLHLDTLFTPQGQQELFAALVEFKSDAIDLKIAELDSILDSNSLKPEDEEYYAEALDLYLNCTSEYDHLKTFRFVPLDGQLKIIYGRCSLHYNRHIDDLWYFEKTIDLEKWDDRLSKIGLKKLRN